jgi:hypothetical protein
MKREDYVFCIGYQGDTAVVDKQAKAKYGKLTTEELAEKGFFRAAFCSALYGGSEQEIRFVIDAYNLSAGTAIADSTEMKRLLGINEISDGTQKTVQV